jgi:serine/threonine protein kinase
MDHVRATRLAGELKGTQVAGWTVAGLLGNGKSALVLAATKGPDAGALKIFDPEMVERLGKKVQIGRIERQCQLIGKDHPNLVRILAGGECASSGLLYIVMEKLGPRTLADALATTPRDAIYPIMTQLASAAQFLESQSPPLVHRDIKPENIAISDDLSTVKVLDLGVIRPVGLGDLTDSADNKPFLGTLRYSSPEYLVRKEDDTLEGWRALTFYQLGAVLHDLIMKRPLFAQYGDPYGRLVEAVRNEIPVIEAKDVPPELIVLARNCLLKDPTQRLRFVTWAHFRQPSASASKATQAKARIANRVATIRVSRSTDSEDLVRARAVERAAAEIGGDVEEIIRGESIANPSAFPRFGLNPLESTSTHVVRFLTCYSTSPDLGLQVYPLLYVTVRILDAASRTVEVRLALGVSNKRISALGPPSTLPPGEPLFEGVFDRAAIAGRLSEVLYVLIDRAQQISESGASRPTGITWFEPEATP